MISFPLLLPLAHLIGLILGVGAATIKLSLLFMCRTDHALVPVYVKVARPITRQIITGQVILTLSGIGWLILGFPFTPRLILKLILVGVIWVLGPVIDNKIEPKFNKLAAALGEPASPEFLRIYKQYLVLEIVATSLFYAIIVLWVLF